MVVAACNSLRTLGRQSTGEPDAGNPHVRFYEGGGGRLARLLLYSTVKKAFKTGMKGMEGMGVRFGHGSAGRFDGQRFASKIPKIAVAILQIQISAFE